MSFTVDTAFVHEFENRIHRQLAENPSELRNTVRIKPGVRGKTYNVERLGSVELVSLTTRHADTPFTEIPHSRRRLTLTDKAGSELIDEMDEVKMLISPESDYAARFAEAYNRFQARTIINALLGSSLAVAADDTVTSITLPSTQQIAAGGTGMTMTKLNQAVRMFNQAGVPQTDRHIAVSGYAIEDLLADTTVTSSDFSNLNALRTGTFPAGAIWMSFQWHVISDAVPDANQLILPKVSTTRSCVAWHKEAAVLGVAKELSVRMAELPTKNYSLQVYVNASMGATRVEEERVIQIDIVE